MSKAAYLRAIVLLWLMAVTYATGYHWWSLFLFVLCCVNNHYANK
jgi:hypothetical protein